jgi:hypothetical protein
MHSDENENTASFDESSRELPDLNSNTEDKVWGVGESEKSMREHKKEALLFEMFAMFDHDGSGEIELDEIREMLPMVGMNTKRNRDNLERQFKVQAFKRCHRGGAYFVPSELTSPSFLINLGCIFTTYSPVYG